MPQACFVQVLAMAMALLMTTPLATAMATSVLQGDCSSNDLTPYDACVPAWTGTVPALPSTNCCAAIKLADLICFCNAVLHADQVADLNQEAALMLPKKCRAIPAGVTACANRAGVITAGERG